MKLLCDVLILLGQRVSAITAPHHQYCLHPEEFDGFRYRDLRKAGIEGQALTDTETLSHLLFGSGKHTWVNGMYVYVSTDSCVSHVVPVDSWLVRYRLRTAKSLPFSPPRRDSYKLH